MHAGLGKLVLLLLLAAASGHAQQTSGQWLWVANPPRYPEDHFHEFEIHPSRAELTDHQLRSH